MLRLQLGLTRGFVDYQPTLQAPRKVAVGYPPPPPGLTQGYRRGAAGIPMGEPGSP